MDIRCQTWVGLAAVFFSGDESPVAVLTHMMVGESMQERSLADERSPHDGG